MKRFNTPQTFLLLYIFVWIYTPATWILNLVKLVRCDFEPIGKEEILHLVGLIPPIHWVTVWF